MLPTTPINRIRVKTSSFKAIDKVGYTKKLLGTLMEQQSSPPNSSPNAPPLLLHENSLFRVLVADKTPSIDLAGHSRAVVMVPVFPNGDLLVVTTHGLPAISESVEFPQLEVKSTEPGLDEALKALALATEKGKFISPARVQQLGKVSGDANLINRATEVYGVVLPEVKISDSFDIEEGQAVRVTRTQFEEMLLGGYIQDGVTLAAWALYRQVILESDSSPFLPPPKKNSLIAISGLGLFFGAAYCLINIFIIMWAGFGGADVAFPHVSGLELTAKYYQIELFLVQVLLVWARPATRFWALLGFLAPWVVIEYAVLDEPSYHRWKYAMALIPVGALLLNYLIERARHALFRKKKALNRRGNSESSDKV